MKTQTSVPQGVPVNVCPSVRLSVCPSVRLYYIAVEQSSIVINSPPPQDNVFLLGTWQMAEQKVSQYVNRLVILSHHEIEGRLASIYMILLYVYV